MNNPEEFKKVIEVINPENNDKIECWYRELPSEIKMANNGLEMIIDTNTMMVLFPEMIKFLTLIRK